MEELIERLTEQKNEEKEQWYGEGFDTGKDYAKNLSLDEFSEIETTRTVDDDMIEHIDNEFWRYSDHYKYVDRESFTAGFVDGILSVWDEVKDSI